MAAEATNKTNTGGQSICGPIEGRTKSEDARGETERADIDGDVETCR